MKKIIFIITFSLLLSGVSISKEQEITFLEKEEGVNSYQAKAISFGLFDKISQTLEIYLKESHVPFMFKNKVSKIKFFPDTPLSELLTFRAISKDLNNDGIDEVIAHVSGNLICGSSGCTTYILQEKEKEWKVIGEFFPGDKIKISLNKTNSYSDIIYFGSRGYLCKFKEEVYQCR